MKSRGRHFVNNCITKLFSIFSIRDSALVALFEKKSKRVKYDHEKRFFYLNLKFIDIINKTLQYYCEYK